MAPVPPFLTLLAGAVLLLAGRRVLWLSLGLVGFAVGLMVAQQVLADGALAGPEWLEWALPLGLGVLGALLSGVMRKLAIRLLGALSGGYLGWVVVEALVSEPSAALGWAVIAVAALAGALLAAWLVDRAVELLTAAVGAHLLVDALSLEPTWMLLATALLALAGFAFQWRRAG